MATQCERVLSMLRTAGKRGVRSDEFFRVGLPRGVARIYDLRKQGYEIDAEPEGKYKRFCLASPCSSTEEQRTSKAMVAGSNPAGGSQACGVTRRSTNEHAGCEDNPRTAGIARRPGRTEVPGDKSEVRAAPERSVPNCFDADVDWTAAA